jgi:putative CocE/NonD family hydrolase
MPSKTDPRFVAAGDAPLTEYDREPTYEGLVSERNVMVEMRDGVHLAVDVYRPETEDKLPALLAFAIHPKDLQGPELEAEIPPQPAWSTLWTGPMEAGDTKYLISRGYVHVVSSPRGIGMAEGGGDRAFDSYDLIEWIAEQPWCDGNVGMIGISGFGAEQLHVAKQNPPHLKAIFPFDSRGAYGDYGGFRNEYPGGVVHLFRFMNQVYSAIHQEKGAAGELPEPQETWWKEAMANPDNRMYPHVYNVLAQKGQHMPSYFAVLINPYDTVEGVEKSEKGFADVKVPTYTGSGWYGYTYKTHLFGCQLWYENIDVPKKLMFAGPAHLDRPFRSFQPEILKWYDHWLKGIDTGIMDEPPVKFYVTGENAWHYADDWPVPETEWTKFYLKGWERLSPEGFLPSTVDDNLPPDTFAQMPPTQTNTIQRLRYMTEPLNRDVTIAGPIVLKLFAAIDRDDTNWIIILKDIGPEALPLTAKDGETVLPDGVRERELTRGWLKASHRALDPERSKPYRPWHRLTREAQQPVPPGEVVEYDIEVASTAHMFRAGHRISVEITSLDLATGVGGASNVEYIPYHICSSKTVVHDIYHDAKRPSHLLLPILPAG